MSSRGDGRILEVETFLQSSILSYLHSVFWPAQEAVAVYYGVDLRIERRLEIAGYYLYGRSCDFVWLVRA
jgi:hypothetical protein